MPDESKHPYRMVAKRRHWACRWFGHDLFVSRCVRAKCGYVRPFVVGKVRP